VNKLFIAAPLVASALVALPLVGCTEEVIRRQAPAATPTPTDPAPTDPAPTDPEPTDAGKAPAQPLSQEPEDRCLDGQDMDAADVDVSTCPAIPSMPDDVTVGKDDISLGAWEIGTTSDGATYKYGTLSSPSSNPRVLKHDTGSSPVNAQNLECWAKGYYRLRKILQDPPAEWVALKNKGFQYRFFQFQTDMRNGPTGYKGISSFQDHLVKWVTVIKTSGVCEQPTLTKFRNYAKEELETRGIPLPTGG